MVSSGRESVQIFRRMPCRESAFACPLLLLQKNDFSHSLVTLKVHAPNLIQPLLHSQLIATEEDENSLPNSPRQHFGSAASKASPAEDVALHQPHLSGAFFSPATSPPRAQSLSIANWGATLFAPHTTSSEMRSEQPARIQPCV